MAKTLMSHPSILCTTRAHLLFLRQSLPSSLLRIPKRHFVSQSAVFSNNSLLSRVDTDKRANISYDGNNFFKGSFGRSSSRGFSAGATPVNDPGAIDSPLMQSMEKKIKEQLETESVTVKDAYGDGRHVSIDVISSAFEGQSAVNRQRMVYKAIWEELQSTVHAVDQMTTRTPAEAASQE